MSETYPDEEGAVRLVKLRMKTGNALRTVNKLYPLECDVDPESTSIDEGDSDNLPQQSGEEERPARRAAVRFRNKLRSLINSGDLT